MALPHLQKPGVLGTAHFTHKAMSKSDSLPIITLKFTVAFKLPQRPFLGNPEGAEPARLCQPQKKKNTHTPPLQTFRGQAT
jgi:hypothetical protein